MKKIYWVLLILTVIASFIAFKKEAHGDVYPNWITIDHPDTPQEFISFYSDHYDVSEERMVRKINCESGFNTKAHNLTEKENSWGLVQINLFAHPYVSVEEATDPRFAIKFMARHLSQGKDIWTCK